MPHLRYLEFYAGVGGWTMALQQAVASINQEYAVVVSNGDNTNNSDDCLASNEVTTECCAAFDHSDLSIAVYQHNFFGHGGNGGDWKNASRHWLSATKIESLTLSDVMAYHADIWMMSPPCQPHTRQHNNQSNDINDTRSNSFLHLCRLLNDMMETSEDARLPSILLLENVIGFESSDSCQRWLQTLHFCRYRIAQFHLQPTQVGVPNDRPRYYCVAVRNHPTNPGRNTTEANGGTCWLSHYLTHQMTESVSSVAGPEDVHKNIYSSLPELGVIPEDAIQYDDLPMLSTYLDSTADEMNRHDDLLVSKTLMQRPAAWCLDIVMPFSRRSSCFTSAYGKYAKGTGSVLLRRNMTNDDRNGKSADQSNDNKFKMIPPEERQYDPNWASNLMDDGGYLRYFSGNELKRLFGYPDTFTFPTNITTRQQWKLIGNSLNVNLTSKMVELALRAYAEMPLPMESTKRSLKYNERSRITKRKNT